MEEGGGEVTGEDERTGDSENFTNFAVVKLTKDEIFGLKVYEQWRHVLLPGLHKSVAEVEDEKGGAEEEKLGDEKRNDTSEEAKSPDVVDSDIAPT